MIAEPLAANGALFQLVLLDHRAHRAVEDAGCGGRAARRAGRAASRRYVNRSAGSKEQDPAYERRIGGTTA